MAEIKKLKEEGTNNKISSIVNHYMEKGLYEDAEKDHLAERSRSMTPSRFDRTRSTSPVFQRSSTPARSSSPVKFFEPGYTMSTYTPERSRSPMLSNSNLEDLSEVMSDGHEIYPHRRTRSYMQKFGSQNDIPSQVDLNDPEIQELLKPKSKLKYDFDVQDNQYTEENSVPLSKRKLLYSPYMDKDFVPKSKQVDENTQKPMADENSTSVYKQASQRRSSVEEEWERKKFIEALDSAVKQTPAQLAQEHFQKQLDMMSTEEQAPPRWRSPTKGILKNTKSAQNMSIKESMPSKRSYESRSYSPSVRSNSYTSNNPSRSYTPDSRSYKSPSPLERSYSTNTLQSRSYSPATKNNRSSSPGNVGQRSYSPAGGYRGNTVRDSGYSTPVPTNNRLRSDNRDYSQPRTLVRHE